MAIDQGMAEESGTSRFPFIPLSRAIERAREIHKNAGQHPMLVSDIPKLWGYEDKSSGWKQTIAALKYYGLITDIGAKTRRQVKTTEDARRYFLDERPQVHEELHRKFALLPKAFDRLWTTWRDEPPADQIARSTLKVEFGYAENAAALLLTLYKANLAFAKLAKAGDDSPVATEDEHRVSPAPRPPRLKLVRVGDYVQWHSKGQEQFRNPQRVNWVSDDGTHVRVFGSMTGIPTGDLTVVDPPKPPPPGQTPRSASSAYAGQDGELSVLLRGNRLEITADVDRAGIERLKEILSKYEEILALLEPGNTA